MDDEKTYFVYMLRCADNSLYTGYTTDLKRRLREHRGGIKGAKYTRLRRVEGIAAAWSGRFFFTFTFTFFVAILITLFNYNLF